MKTEILKTLCVLSILCSTLRADFLTSSVTSLRIWESFQILRDGTVDHGFGGAFGGPFDFQLTNPIVSVLDTTTGQLTFDPVSFEVPAHTWLRVYLFGKKPLATPGLRSEAGAVTEGP